MGFEYILRFNDNRVPISVLTDGDSAMSKLQKFWTDRIPCSHSILAMKAENFQEFPRCCINRDGYKMQNQQVNGISQTNYQKAFQAHVLPIFFLLFQPNFSFPFQLNDVNGPQPWSRLFLTGSRDAQARVSREEKKRERNRERGLLVTSVTAEAISEGIIPDHPLAYLWSLDEALPLLGDRLHFW
ncbi:hypothetical protein M9H77_01965 [Catharanthus roseus]|uniref:Uncharacterized protein n=1 Tax=Catharanthus roseus TaxID=4058 RepID=A0ACC0C6Z0_CATRO|nr:hypothetical protein M9H77_01965 [Catharanthus roseus]